MVGRRTKQPPVQARHHQNEVVALWEDLKDSSGAETFSGRGETQRYWRDSKTFEETLHELFASDVYSQYREAKRPRYFNPAYSWTPKTLESDLAVLPQRMLAANSGYRYVLVIICAYDRFVRLRPLKSKTAREMAAVLSDVLRSFPHVVDNRIRYLRTDLGREFKNREVVRVLERFNIELYPSSNHAYRAERLIRTFWTLLAKFQAKQKSFAFIQHLPLLERRLNLAPHRHLGGMSPLVASLKPMEPFVNKATSISHLKTGEHFPQKAKFKVDQYVRILRDRDKFSKSQEPRYTEEIFQIRQILNHFPRPLYLLKDVIGTFRQEELQLYTKPVGEREYSVQILDERMRGGRKEILVKWLHYRLPDEWIPATNLATT